MRTDPRLGARIAVLGIVLMLLPAAGAVEAATPAAGGAEAMVGWINDVRSGHGLRPLEPDAELVHKAGEWSAHLARVGYLEHSRLSDGISADWVALAENLAMSATVEAAHKAFLASPRHFANIVDTDMDRIGVGVTAAGGVLYVVEVFMQLGAGHPGDSGQPAPS